MRRALVVLVAVGVIAGATGCGGAHVHTAAQTTRIAIPADKPPSPTTWPPYPHFSGHSCWARPFGRGVVHKVEQAAPSYTPAPRTHPVAPAVVARRLLARLGDRRYVRAIRFSPAPSAVGHRVRALYAGGHPPADALQAQIVVRATNVLDHPSPEQSLTAGIAQYEGEIVGGALRDDMCDAGGAPLVMWAAANGGGGFAESFRALDQRYPNPTPAAFPKRVALIGERFGFSVVSLRLLRPRQIAPLLIVKTQRSREAFVKDIPRIMELLNPRATSAGRGAATFEAFFFAAKDAKGPFTFSDGVSRGVVGGSEWAANRCLYPFPVLGPVGPNTKPCP